MVTYPVDMELVKELEEKAYQIRRDLLQFIYRIGMGHLGGELSLVEMAVALYYHYMNYDPKNPKWENRDRLVLSKGTAGKPSTPSSQTWACTPWIIWWSILKL